MVFLFPNIEHKNILKRINFIYPGMVIFLSRLIQQMSLSPRWFIVKLNRCVQIVNYRHAEGVMVVRREKKKMSYEDLERHVINWAVEQLSDLRECTFEIEDDATLTDEKRLLLLSNLSKTVDDLLCLLNPLRHDAVCLVEWGFNFVDEYSNTSYAQSDTN